MNAILGGVVQGGRWVRGSANEFEALVEARLDASYRLAAALLGNRLEAEDATHEAMLRAQRAWSSVRDPGAATAWLNRIVINECRDRLRRRRVTRGVLAPRGTGREAATLGDEQGSAERSALRAGLAMLSPDHRVVVVLRYLLDLPVDEIATQVGIPAGTVRSRLHYALRDLRAAYDAADRLETD
jgi:RNA polymerase sigma-70 factor (ECF subfamily)